MFMTGTFNIVKMLIFPKACMASVQFLSTMALFFFFVEWKNRFIQKCKGPPSCQSNIGKEQQSRRTHSSFQNLLQSYNNQIIMILLYR